MNEKEIQEIYQLKHEVEMGNIELLKMKQSDTATVKEYMILKDKIETKCKAIYRLSKGQINMIKTMDGIYVQEAIVKAQMTDDEQGYYGEGGI